MRTILLGLGLLSIPLSVTETQDVQKYVTKNCKAVLSHKAVFTTTQYPPPDTYLDIVCK